MPGTITAIRSESNPSSLRDVCRLLVTLLLSGLSVNPILSQDLNWQAHTSMREVTALTRSNETIWAATTGGVFSYQPVDGEIKRFSMAEGLHGTRVNAVAFDADCGEAGCIWAGYPDGVIDRLDIASGEVRSLRDIARAGRFPTREIHRVVVHGDSLLVTTSFGLVVMDAVKEEVRDSYDQLGTIPPATEVFDVTVAPAPNGARALWLATAQGIAFAPLDAPNLKDPDAWTVESLDLPSTSVRSITAYNGLIYVGTEEGLAFRNTDGSYTAVPVTNRVVTDLLVDGEQLLGVERFGLFVVNPDGSARMLTSSSFQDPTEIVMGPEGALWIGDLREGLVRAERPTGNATQLTVTQAFYPTGPYHSLFENIDFDAEGNLWAAGGFGEGTGFYRRTPEGEWTDFIARNFNELQNRSSFTQIHVEDNGILWAGSAGSGLVEVSVDGALQVFDQNNSSLRRAESTTNESFIIVGGIGTEKVGRLWVTNTDAARPLHVRSDDSEWQALPLPSCTGITSSNATLGEILIDAYDQKWIIVIDKRSLNTSIGLLVLDTGNTPNDASDDECNLFNRMGSAGQGLPSTVVNSVVEDKEGLVWIGTDKGLAFVRNSSVVASDRAVAPQWPQYADRSQGVYLFQGLRINDLAVDPANRLWVASERGVFLIEQAAGGYQIVHHFTEQNSPLFSDVVVAVAVDERTGQVYFSTERGLVSYQGAAIAAVEQPQDLLVYPNPVRILEGAVPDVYIEGLVEQTEVMIVAAHGEVVNRFEARGGRARWDGRSLTGELVPSGVYLVVAVGQNGEKTAYGKVAVIR